MAVPYTFGAATAAIPLSQLDSNFASTITLGNTAIQLGNTVTILNNMTFANVTVSSGTVSVTTATATTANLVTINATTLNAATHRSDASLVLQTNGTTTAVTIDNAQNVGVGVTPSAWATYKAVQVVGGSLASYAANDLDLASNCYWNGTNYIYLYNQAATHYRQVTGTHQWNIAASGTAGNTITFTQAMTLDLSGNLLVGTTGITGGLNGKVFNLFDTGTVRSIVQTTGQYAVYNIGSGGTSSSPATAGYILTDSSENTLSLQTSTSTPIYVKANGTGGVYLTAGATSWTSVSDETRKDIIEPIINAASKVSTLRAVIGKYKTDEKGIRRSFLIAQDVQAVFPEAVNSTEDTDGVVLGLTYTDVIPLLVAAIQEQQSLIQSLTDRLTALEGAAK